MKILITTDCYTPTINGIKSKIQDVADAVTGVADKIRSFLHFSVPDEGPLTDFESWMPDFMQGLANGISANAGMVNDALSTFGTNITAALTETFKTAMTNIVTTVQTFMENVFTEVTNIWNNIQTNMSAVLANIGSAVKMGCNAIIASIKTSLENIKTAISTSWTAVKNIVTTATDSIRNVINKSKKYVETAVSGVADAMQLTMESGLSMKLDGISGAMMNGGGTTVINNYNNDNSRTVNQTNNSPKSLSRLEIYRQTRNALKI